MISSVSIPVETTQTYTITFRYINRASSQNTDQGKTLSGKIQIKDINAPLSPFAIDTFAYTLLENTPPTNTTVTAPGRVAATTNEGLIEGPDDDYGDTTYYYRGAVTNNYVSFANKTWRIIRINGDGTVRMILDDFTNTTGSVWNANYLSTNNTGLTYITYSNSTIKGNVETWYNTNIGNNATYSSKVSTTKFCSDKSPVTSWTGSRQYFGPSTRLAGEGAWNSINASPIMTCPSASNIYNLNVGLITADEAAFAGSGYNLTNQNYYLYNLTLTTPTYWWTLSPNLWDTDGSFSAFIISSANGFFTVYGLNSVRGVRPVISLNSDITVTTASPTNPGTSSNPYIVE